MKTIKLELEVKDLNALFTAIGSLPINQGLNLFNTIKEQAEKQLQQAEANNEIINENTQK